MAAVVMISDAHGLHSRISDVVAQSVGDAPGPEANRVVACGDTLVTCGDPVVACGDTVVTCRAAAVAVMSLNKMAVVATGAVAVAVLTPVTAVPFAEVDVVETLVWTAAVVVLVTPEWPMPPGETPLAETPPGETTPPVAEPHPGETTRAAEPLPSNTPTMESPAKPLARPPHVKPGRGLNTKLVSRR